MINTKEYTNLKYFNGQNEPIYFGFTYANWKTATQNIITAFQNKNLTSQVTITGNDFYTFLDTAPQIINLSANDNTLVGAYDMHIYAPSSVSGGNVETTLTNQVNTVRTNDPSNKPILVSEFGWAVGNGNNGQPNRTSYNYGMEMADFAMQIARAGASAGSAWSLDDQGNQEAWGMWNIRSGDGPYPWFYSYSLLTRFFQTASTIYRPSSSVSGLRVVAAKKASDWTVALINRTSSAQAVTVNAPGAGSVNFNLYNYFDGNRYVDINGLPLPVSTLTGDFGTGLSVTVGANSMVLLTTLAGSASPRLTIMFNFSLTALVFHSTDLQTITGELPLSLLMEVLSF